MPINKTFILTTTATLLLATTSTTEAFTTVAPNVHSSTTSLNALNNGHDKVSERRAFLRNAAGLAFGGAMGMLANEQPASATYSGYTQRENDWNERKDSGGKATSINSSSNFQVPNKRFEMKSWISISSFVHSTFVIHSFQL